MIGYLSNSWHFCTASTITMHACISKRCHRLAWHWQCMLQRIPFNIRVILYNTGTLFTNSLIICRTYNILRPVISDTYQQQQQTATTTTVHNNNIQVGLQYTECSKKRYLFGTPCMTADAGLVLLLICTA